jgi:dCMP deaminase
MKTKFQSLYMDWALRVAELSHAKRLQVGAVIVKDDTVISYGYNGMPAGWDNNCENRVYANEWSIDNSEWHYKDENGKPYNLKTKPEVLHAESNAIAKLAKSHNSGLGADVFVTHSPCIECAKLIYQSGVKRVFFGEAYRDDSGVRFLTNSGVEVVQLT